MNIQLSNFLKASKSSLKDMVTKLSREFKYVSILGVDTHGMKYQVTKTGASLGNSDWNERGFVLRVHNGINYSEHSFNVIPEDIVAFTTTLAQSINKELELLNSFSTNEYELINEEAITDSYYGSLEEDPFSVSPEVVMSQLENIVKSNCATSDKIVDVRASFEAVQVSKIFISNEKDLEQSYVWSQGSCVSIAREEENSQFYYDATAGLQGLEIISNLATLASEVTENALGLLAAEAIEPGMYDIICAPDMAGLIAHEAFGHGVEMDMFVKNRAKSVEYLEKAVASKHVNMHDGAKSAHSVSSYLFDDEGTIGTDTQIIENGILKNGISDVLSALKLNSVPTGNGKRESFERKAYARMTNTIFKGGHDKLEDMIKSIKHGYLLESALGGMEDPKNWGIQCEALVGKEIINGQLTGKIVSPVLLTGYVPDLLQSIDMVSEEVKVYGSGACGKGHKEWVKTADGGPYLKTKGRLG